ncbi:septal ring lytic transglycosylase RlpA family protein [Hyphomicrobium sp.]|uniref:septal ring lytic transglycosylase RlpA family protein n=1 Tax=Hyphomicrobium sp. TaxID=82 RepID=UPI000FA40CD2|nr:septal ring lytic transglycosylase RlpA family protein [Hyphomicrobium sp.]RUP10897.1 MAG: septal ring lytic transglycosylase RlpA family protein [Hyphomicrobium sp.]
MERRVSGALAACRLAVAAIVAALTTGCSSNNPSPGSLTGVSRSVFSEDDYGVRSSPRVASENIPKGGGHFKLGSPYKVAGRWYVPREDPNYQEYGVASWYGADFHGRKTANGEVFDAKALTAAHPTLPLPCYAYVTNLANGRTVLVRVNDRGPYVNDRLIDMSYAAAKQLGYIDQGRARVRVRFAGLAPLNGDDTREKQFLASQERGQRPDQWAPVAPARQYAAAESRSSGLPPDSSDRWSATAYRAALAGKPVRPPPAAATTYRPYVETASYTEPQAGQGRMALSAPQPQPFVPQRFAAASGDAYGGMDAGPANSGARAYGSDRTYVQVGIFRDRSNAERLRRELGSLGPVEVAPLQVGGGSQAYRVRVGPFSQADASRTQSRIATYGVAGTAIVSD